MSETDTGDETEYETYGSIAMRGEDETLSVPIYVDHRELPDDVLEEHARETREFAAEWRELFGSASREVATRSMPSLMSVLMEQSRTQNEIYYRKFEETDDE